MHLPDYDTVYIALELTPSDGFIAQYILCDLQIEEKEISFKTSMSFRKDVKVTYSNIFESALGLFVETQDKYISLEKLTAENFPTLADRVVNGDILKALDTERLQSYYRSYLRGETNTLLTSAPSLR